MKETVKTILDAYGVVTVAYFALLNLTYVAFTALAWRSITGHLRARRYSGVSEALASPLTPPVSMLLPAYNEEAGIVESVHSLLALLAPAELGDAALGGVHLAEAADRAALAAA